MKQKHEIKKLSDLQIDNHNANRGTERGQAALEDSLRRYGAGRSILIDKNGRIIAGNKTVEQAGQIGMDDVQVVQSDGKKIVAVQRIDIDLERDPEARALAIADNRVGQLDLLWDAQQLLEDAESVGSLEPFFTDEEIRRLVEQANQANPEGESNNQEKEKDTIAVTITFRSEAEKMVWDSYLQHLRKVYPHYETNGERIIADIGRKMGRINADECD